MTTSTRGKLGSSLSSAGRPALVHNTGHQATNYPPSPRSRPARAIIGPVSVSQRSSAQVKHQVLPTSRHHSSSDSSDTLQTSRLFCTALLRCSPRHTDVPCGCFFLTCPLSSATKATYLVTYNYPPREPRWPPNTHVSCNYAGTPWRANNVHTVRATKAPSYARWAPRAARVALHTSLTIPST